MAKIKITLVKSTIGSLQKHKKNVEALGLTKPGSSTIQEDTPAVRGKIKAAEHLLKVENVD